jgi:uncharacterized protein GlcG (DUF336 family)
VPKLKTLLPLAAADAIVNEALSLAEANGMNPLTVAVLDLGGHLVVLKRADGAGNVRADVAIAKAWGALGMGESGRAGGERLKERIGFQVALVGASRGRYAATAGGVLVLDEAGEAIGAVGISGDTSDKDEFCAVLGILHAGYRSDPGAPIWTP